LEMIDKRVHEEKVDDDWHRRQLPFLCMLTYADVCWRMLMYADVCWCMLTRGRCLAFQPHYLSALAPKR
jgi:hypothetical protein